MHCIGEVLQESIMITAFVLIIMLFIEVLNTSTQGAWSRNMSKAPLGQIFLAALLGCIPGCFGGFAAVSLYTHGIFHFGALLAAMICNIGDEAFVMLVQMPEKTFVLLLVLYLLAVLCGSLVWKFSPSTKTMAQTSQCTHFEIHNDDQMSFWAMAGQWKEHLKNISFSRALLLMGLMAFILTLLLGGFEHSHHLDVNATDQTYAQVNHFHLPMEEKWFNMVFLVLAVVLMIFVVIADDHFLEHHLWGHVIKHHFLKIFLWCLAALLVIHFINERVEALNWISQNSYIVLIMAVLVGLIPQSGPHLVLISLYLSGHVSWVILLANSIVQDGHSALPLLAESKKIFFKLKAVKAAIALALGLIFLL